MEQKAKKYEDLNRYERAMTNASLEQRLEAMAQDLGQIAVALNISINLSACFHNWADDPHATSSILFVGDDQVTRRDLKNAGDFFGVVEEALTKKPDTTPED